MFVDITPNDERWYDLDDLPNEEWRDVKDFESLYQVSNYGRVKRLSRTLKAYILYQENATLKAKIIKPSYNHEKYLKVVLTRNNKKYNKTVHRLVAEVFIPNPENKPDVNHIIPVTKAKCINRVDNLEWCTKSENTQHMIKLYRNNNGSANRVYSAKGSHVMAKKINKIDENLNIVCTFECVKDAIEDSGRSSSYFYKCLKENLIIGGFKYTYEDNNY